MNGGTLAAIDAIGLLEATFATKTDINVAVTAPTEARIARLVKREGISEVYARSRIEAQHSNEYFSQHCDHTLHNDGTQAEFEQICKKFFTEVLDHD